MGAKSVNQGKPAFFWGRVVSCHLNVGSWTLSVERSLPRTLNDPPLRVSGLEAYRLSVDDQVWRLSVRTLNRHPYPDTLTR